LLKNTQRLALLDHDVPLLLQARRGGLGTSSLEHLNHLAPLLSLELLESSGGETFFISGASGRFSHFSFECSACEAFSQLFSINRATSGFESCSILIWSISPKKLGSQREVSARLSPYQRHPRWLSESWKHGMAVVPTTCSKSYKAATNCHHLRIELQREDHLEMDQCNKWRLSPLTLGLTK
jgi:hypothetical protein